ncbi:MAG: hypothetical protein NTW12_07340 [Deltaproteobacteria bacterium]|nr:hypothetical protein [Deltaproteobacteria bacterium]
MRTGSHQKAHSTISSVVLVIALLLVTGCSLVQHSIAVLRSTDHFIPSGNDNRVLFEPGAEGYAEKVASFLPSAIQQVEEKQYRHFVEPVRVYVCGSRESFKKYYGADVPSGVLTKLFLSPRIFEYGDEIAKKYLTHELSHLHLHQQLGVYKMSKLPMWFKEGLATYVSNGGGANLISQKQAIEFIRSGKYFVPNKADGFIFKKTPSDFGLEPHMFYRQSMMFISYLAAINELGFQKLLLSVESGECFSTVLQSAYNEKLEELWDGFLRGVNKEG